MWALILVGIVVHIILLLSIFDIYFVSPIDHGMVSHKSTAVRPAKRVVLIVGDGLRAEALYNTEMPTNAPFLHSIKENRGTWGVSHTRVPTESRPGHVAILAGIYEDPSAIMKGWKSNPVDFDSVINQSSNAWCWGSPDIINMFNKDALSHIHLETYDAKLEDFSGKNSTSILDQWVFDKVGNLFKNQTERSSCTDFCEDGNLFFLHLLGIDTAGHAFKPHSSQYMDNINIVDKGIEKLEQWFEDFFKDNSTAYIFTADHGMTDWGSHGAGSAHETESPIIAWGAGVPKNSNKNDVKQADIAPLLSSLIGINIPVNSVGVVPLKYIKGSKQQNASILASNARQLAEQYNLKRLKKERDMISLFYRPFKALTESNLNNSLERIEYHLSLKQYNAAARQSYQLIKLSLEGIHYFHTYHQQLLLLCVSSGFIGWIVYVFILIFNASEKVTTLTGFREIKIIIVLTSIRIILFMTTVPVCLLLYFQSLPWMYYIYCTFPLIMWWAVMNEANEIIFTYLFIKDVGFFHSIFKCVSYLLRLELLVYSFFERRALTCLMLFLALWVFSLNGKIKKADMKNWIIICLILAVFPLLPVMDTFFNYAIFCVTTVVWGLITYCIVKNMSQPLDNKWFKHLEKPIVCQVVIFAVSLVNVLLVTFSIDNKFGLLFFNQMVSWVIFAASLLLPLFSSKIILTKLSSIALSLMSVYMLMSVNYEGLFMAFFVIFLHIWILTEHKIAANKIKLERLAFDEIFNAKRMIDGQDFRRGFFFLSFIMLAFFGTGNIASLNSFDPMWVRCFLTVFSPFTMTGLILVKIIIPFLFVTCAFRAINIITNGKTSNLFTIVLFFCDLLVVHFLFFVKNEGSWLEIGMSISHFIIVEATTIFLLVLYGISYILTTVNIIDLSHKTIYKRRHYM